MLQSRCRAAALASFEAFNERNHILGGSQCSMELLSADATEKILTFEETLQLTDDHLYALWKKIDAGIPKLSKALGTHNRLVQKTRNIQKYQKDELEKLQVKLRGIFSTMVMPQGITEKLNRAVQNCLLEKKLIPALIALPSYRDQLQRDQAAFSESNGTLKKLAPLLEGNRELLISSKDMCIDMNSIPSFMRDSLFQSELRTVERTPNKTLSLVGYPHEIIRDQKKQQKRKLSLSNNLSDTSKKGKTEKKGYYMPTGLIPLLGNKELTKA